MSETDHKLELLTLLENDRLAKIELLNQELDYISKLKDRYSSAPKLGQKRKM